MNPRVLIFSLAYFPHVGGAEVAVREITERNPNITFELITLRLHRDDPKESQEGKVHVYRVGFPGFFGKVLSPLFALAKLITLTSSRRYDVWWVMMVTYIGSAPYAYNLLFPWKRVPVLLTLQEGDAEEHIRRKGFGLAGYLWRIVLSPFLWLQKKKGLDVSRDGMISVAWSLALARSDMVQVISTYLAQRARVYGYTGPLEMVPNAVNTAHFAQSYSEQELARVRDELGKKNGDVFLVTTSRLVTKNAVDDVVRALAALPENVHFVVFGTGPDEAMLTSLAEEKGVVDRVHFRGQIGHKEMPLYMKACDIFIRPSRSEGMGISFVEAMAAELPVIATQEGGIADFLFDERRNPEKPTTGWAVDKDAPEHIAAAVRDIVARPEKVASVVQTAKQLAIKEYDWNLIARDMREKVFVPLFNRSAH